MNVEDSTQEDVVVEEENKSRDFDLPEMDEFHESVEEKPKQEPPANFVIAFWQFFMTVFFFQFLEGNDKKLTNEPAYTTATTSSIKKES